ncbi:helix-turn-helix transcriptional regulator [Mesorhizobium sp. B2-4-12]|uniref:helix-turn-helix domain-containing protein n=1 Tax=unclassified Mesorhizobium TaxID=325217 RepID=UPI00112EE82C|nr:MULTISPECIES: helix-turn-helix transcriptional regulator [unclassified Mesorhizobium]TPK86279.1 helix-turn-helix transcriptional regulator [Mesorhizobium sp. B2-4-17]TPK92762.1 helix-turn-helix transcriptional regulator [Mesorhizobium sp. B2-4-12]TPL09536.1 helix-turn-helix transcriptional regulator [Mesorhizobium sp. B2-4-14]UCI29512.1 helix-turn-helix transcriptional regulator [Mesorhizobium sp. B4-1-4]
MNAPQIIKTSTGEELVVIPKADYEALLHAAEEALEDAADVAIYDERKADLKTEKALPADVTMDILRGSGRLKALRNWRKLTQAELANAIGVSQGFLSDIESNRRKPSAQTTAMLAKALDVPGEWLES